MRTFAVAALAGLVAATPMTDAEFQFINYVAKFGKSYATVEEYNARLAIFVQKNAEINRINAEQSSFKLGLNKFTDYTDAEYKKLLGYKPAALTTLPPWPRSSLILSGGMGQQHYQQAFGYNGLIDIISFLVGLEPATSGHR